MRTQADIAKGPIDLAVDMDNENWLLIHQKEFEAGIGYHFSEYPWTFAKSVVHALMPKIKELEAKLALAEGEWKTYATSCESLSKKLAEANEMLTSSGIDELQDKLNVAEIEIERLKNCKQRNLMNIEEDVGALIMFANANNEPGKEKSWSDVLGVCLKTHGLEAVKENLESRNQTGIIAGLVDILEELKELRDPAIHPVSRLS